MIRTVFREIKFFSEAKTFCRQCKTKLKRRTSEYQTVNPWNRNQDGSVKTPEQIQKEVLGKLADWKELVEMEGVVCKKCEEPQQ